MKSKDIGALTVNNTWSSSGLRVYPILSPSGPKTIAKYGYQVIPGAPQVIIRWSPGGLIGAPLIIMWSSNVSKVFT